METAWVYVDDDTSSNASLRINQLSKTPSILVRLTPLIARIQNYSVRKSFYVIAIRNEDQGGFEVPMDLISVAALNGLAIEISIAVFFDDVNDDD